jgi:hypothetical protein
MHKRSKVYGNVIESGRARLEEAMTQIDCWMIDRDLIKTLEAAVADYKQAVAILEAQEAERAARWNA